MPWTAKLLWFSIQANDLKNTDANKHLNDIYRC